MVRESLLVAVKENFKDARILAFENEDEFTSAPTITNTISHTSMSTSMMTNTPNPTLTLTSTQTLTPTIAPSPTLVVKYPDVSIGLFDLGETCFNLKVQERLARLGFSVDLIQLDISYEELKEFDVLYLSDGWHCKMDEVERMASVLKTYMIYDGGLLIGNPDVSKLNYSSSILPFDINFRSSEYIDDWPAYKNCASCNTHYLINNLDETEFPVPENIVDMNEGSYFVVTRGNKSGYPSLIVPSSNSLSRFVIMPGGETDSSKYYVSDDLVTRVIFYLAELNDEEWVD